MILLDCHTSHIFVAETGLWVRKSLTVSVSLKGWNIRSGFWMCISAGRCSIKMKFISIALALWDPQGVSSTHYPKMCNSNSWGGGSLRFVSQRWQRPEQNQSVQSAAAALCQDTLLFLALTQQQRLFLGWFLTHILFPFHPTFTAPSAWFVLTTVYTGIDLVIRHVGRELVISAVFYQFFKIFPCAPSKGSKHPHEKERSMHRKKEEEGSTLLLGTWR